jgi:hypothetical protein
VQVVAADLADDTVAFEDGEDLWLHPCEPKRRPLRFNELVDLCELFGAL